MTSEMWRRWSDLDASRISEAGGERELGAVVGDEADGGAVVPGYGVRQREQAWPGRWRGREAAEGELQDDEVVALVGKEVRGRLRGTLLHPLGRGGDVAGHSLAGYGMRRRRHGPVRLS